MFLSTTSASVSGRWREKARSGIVYRSGLKFIGLVPMERRCVNRAASKMELSRWRLTGDLTAPASQELWVLAQTALAVWCFLIRALRNKIRPAKREYLRASRPSPAALGKSIVRWIARTTKNAKFINYFNEIGGRGVLSTLLKILTFSPADNRKLRFTPRAKTKRGTEAPRPVVHRLSLPRAAPAQLLSAVF